MTTKSYQRKYFPTTMIPGPLSSAWKSISLGRHSVDEEGDHHYWILLMLFIKQSHIGSFYIKKNQ